MKAGTLMGLVVAFTILAWASLLTLAFAAIQWWGSAP